MEGGGVLACCPCVALMFTRDPPMFGCHPKHSGTLVGAKGSEGVSECEQRSQPGSHLYKQVTRTLLRM